MKKLDKKLELNKEVIAQLDQTNVVGGGYETHLCGGDLIGQSDALRGCDAPGLTYSLLIDICCGFNEGVCFG